MSILPARSTVVATVGLLAPPARVIAVVRGKLFVAPAPVVRFVVVMSAMAVGASSRPAGGLFVQRIVAVAAIAAVLGLAPDIAVRAFARAHVPSIGLAGRGMVAETLVLAPLRSARAGGVVALPVGGFALVELVTAAVAGAGSVACRHPSSGRISARARR